MAVWMLLQGERQLFYWRHYKHQPEKHLIRLKSHNYLTNAYAQYIVQTEFRVFKNHVTVRDFLLPQLNETLENNLYVCPKNTTSKKRTRQILKRNEFGATRTQTPRPRPDWFLHGSVKLRRDWLSSGKNTLEKKFKKKKTKKKGKWLQKKKSYKLLRLYFGKAK